MFCVYLVRQDTKACCYVFNNVYNEKVKILKLCLLWFCNTTLCDWLEMVGKDLGPVLCKTSRLHCFELGLVYWHHVIGQSGRKIIYCLNYKFVNNKNKAEPMPKVKKKSQNRDLFNNKKVLYWNQISQVLFKDLRILNTIRQKENTTSNNMKRSCHVECQSIRTG